MLKIKDKRKFKQGILIIVTGFWVCALIIIGMIKVLREQR